MKQGQCRRRDLDRGKTLGVLLVVLGHLVARADPAGSGWGAAWYEPLRGALYAFHIPLLFYLSGYAAGWSGAAEARGRAWLRLLGRRAMHWLLPALLLGLAILAGKSCAAGWLQVDHAPASFRQGLMALLWQTGESPAQSVWYLIVLFAYAALVPPLLALCGGRRGLALALSLAFMPWPLPPHLFADRLLLYLPFYLAGLLAEAHDGLWCAVLDRARGPLLLAFALVFLGLLTLGATERLMRLPQPALLLGASLVALPALHAAMRGLPEALLRPLDRLAPHAFAIYLLNTIFIGLAKAALLRLLPWQAAWFPLFAPVLLTAGICGPLVAHRLWRERPRPGRRLQLLR